MTFRRIVDTNVAVIANQRDSPNATPACARACAAALRKLTEGGGTLLLDDRRRVVNEYMNNLRSSGQPGVGDSFLKWVLTNFHNPNRCVLVAITEHDQRGFVEFPDDVRLETFDRADRKFVAISVRAKDAPILVGLDSDWWHARTILNEHGVRIEFLCPEIERRRQFIGG